MNNIAIIETERLIFRNWTLSEEDRAFFHHIHSDNTIRQFYVDRLDRKSSDERLEKLVEDTTNARFNWGVACLRRTGEPIGFTGLAPVGYETSFTPAVEIGWMYDTKFWGYGYATEAAHALLNHGFEVHNLDEIVAFAVHNNRASIAIMERIGMTKVSGGEFEHPRIPDTHQHLKTHVLYQIRNPSRHR